MTSWYGDTPIYYCCSNDFRRLVLAYTFSLEKTLSTLAVLDALESTSGYKVIVRFRVSVEFDSLTSIY